MFKLGNTDDMKKRLRIYNTGNANNIEPLFVMKVDDINMVEGCIKNVAREYQYKKNKEVYNKYFEKSKSESNIFFGGRLAEYKYYDMHQVIESALSFTERFSDNG